MTAAIVLAAGLSTRMGQPKLIMPWAGSTVIGTVVDILIQADLAPVIVVCGAIQAQIAAVLGNRPVHLVFNPGYQVDQMVLSLQVGLAELPKEVDSALVVLGDQPQIELSVVRAVSAAGRHSEAACVVPSFQMHRGHPWLVKRSLFPAILAVRPPLTLRDFLNEHAAEIFYLNVNNPSILQDLDTPADYRRQAPQLNRD